MIFPACLRRGLVVLGLMIIAETARAAANADNAELAARIVLLASADDPGSLQIARHYADVRGVPRENIIALPSLSKTQTITWDQFVTTLWEPLMRELTKRNWITVLSEGDPKNQNGRDDVGRTKRVVTGHRIAYLIVCRGVPLRISHDSRRYRENLPFTSWAQYRTNQGAVDSELSLIPQGNYPINATVPNVLFGQKEPTGTQLSNVIKVARLDGPDVDSANALVDHAIEAEKTREKQRAHAVLAPERAYVDMGGLSPLGDEWLESAARSLEQAGYAVTVERTKATFTVDAPFEDPMFYFGWYAWNINGPFTKPGFRFPPGAVALHIHSFSASTVRSEKDGWCGPFVARGVTATFGNVYEPYLNLTHHVDMLVDALVRGERIGDAAYYALPALSWQEIVIGDPLYRPCEVKSHSE